MVSNYFRLNNTDFGIGRVRLLLPVTEQVLTLEIIGSEELATTIASDETQVFNWILYPPKIYFRDVPYTITNGVKSLTVNNKLLDEYDIALYLLVHNDLFGTLSISADGIITFSGTTQLDGEELPLEILCVANS